MRICTEIRKYVTGGAQCAPPGANRVNFETPVIPEELATVVKSHIQLIVKTEKGFAK